MYAFNTDNGPFFQYLMVDQVSMRYGDGACSAHWVNQSMGCRIKGFDRVAKVVYECP